MRRCLVTLLVAALVAAPAAVSSLHVHEYVDHDHPDHHHGPASHEHHDADMIAAAADDHARVGDSDDAPHFESCDPGRHAEGIVFTPAPSRPVDLGLADGDGLPALAAPVSLRASMPVTDVRVHGPPFDPRIPSRAPPRTHLS